jgi:BED zinc finger
MATSQEPINQVSTEQNPTTEPTNVELINQEGTTPTSIEGSSATPITVSGATPASNSGTATTPTSSLGGAQAPSQPEEVDTSKLKSDVWAHMTKKLIDGKFKAVCKYCGTKLAAGSNSGTRHIKAHVESCLRKKQQTFPKAFQKMLANKKSEGKTAIGNYIFDQEGSRKDLVEMVVLHEHPLSIVEQVGFKIFVNNLQPLFKIPTRNTVRRDILKLYVDRMKKTMALMESNEGRVAITTDMWTADNQKKSYMAVTAHFVDDS